MNEVYDTLNSLLIAVEKARARLKQRSGGMVRNRDELQLIKGLVRLWVDLDRASLEEVIAPDGLSTLNSTFDDLLRATERQVLRTQYESKLVNLKTHLLTLRQQAISHSAKNALGRNRRAPEFSPLIKELPMQEFLRLRWNECEQCVKYRLPLSATVMIGGLLETLLYARVRAEPDQKKVYTAKAAPRTKDLRVRDLKEWGLQDYIQVGRELEWISDVGKDVSKVLMDYRNYIHPHKQVIDNVLIAETDADIIWEVGKKLAQQVIASADRED